MSQSIGGRIRGRRRSRRSRSMNNREQLQPVPFIESNRSLRRSARRWQPRRTETENHPNQNENRSDTNLYETTIQQT